MPISAVLMVNPGKNAPFGAAKKPQMSISAPISNPIQGPSIYPPTAIGRPVRVISVTADSGIRRKDRITPSAISMALMAIT